MASLLQRSRSVARCWQVWAIACSYAACVVGLFWQFALLPNRQIPLTPSSDQVQQVWFLAWPAHAIAHGMNPFTSHAINVPNGINLLTNTAEPLLGLVFAPLTWLAGPLATYVVVLELGFLCSALSAAAAARWLGTGWFGSWLAGLTFGFGAPRLVNGVVHAYFTVDVVLPWILVGVVAFATERWSSKRAGLTLGTLLGVDVLISSERVAITAIALAAFGVGFLLVRRTASAWRAVLELASWGALALIVLAGYPVWMLLAGPGHVHGAPHAYIQHFTTTAASLVQPGPWALVAPFGHLHAQLDLSAEGWTNGTYLGVPLIGAALVGAWLGRRRPTDRWIAIATVAALLASFGRTLPCFGVALPSPYRLVARLPLVADIIPGRFIELTLLGAAILAARTGDAVVHAVADRVGSSASPTLLRRATSGVIVGGFASVLVATMVPAHTIRAGATTTAGSEAAIEVARLVPSGARVLTYPYPVSVFNTAMLDQAVAGMRYDLMGGQAIAPGPDGSNAGIVPRQPQTIVDLFLHAYLGPGPITLNFPVGPTPPLNAATVAAMRAYVANSHVTAIVWQRTGHHPALARRYLEAAFAGDEVSASRDVAIFLVAEG